ncbi:MAG: ATPase [Hyphomicrobiales bacterium]|nr:MAG: ATPase [Hyphomicrobiales bacterium]
MTRTDRAQITVRATTDTVYAALTNPTAREKWLPPTGMSGRHEHFDLRVGGGYRMVLTYDDASAAPGKSSADSDVVEARFTALDLNREVAEAVEFVSDDPGFAGTMTMVWRLEAAATGTLVTITAHDVPEGISAADHAEGLSASLQNLAAFVG